MLALTLCACGGIGAADITENTTGLDWVNELGGAVFSDSGDFPGVTLANDPCARAGDATPVMDRLNFTLGDQPGVGGSDVAGGFLCSESEAPCSRSPTSGTATFTSVEPDRWEGSFRLEFPEGVVAGDFVAERCP